MRDRLTPMTSSVSVYTMLRPLPPFISILVSRFVPTIGLTTSGYLPGCVTLTRWSDQSKVMGDPGHLRKAGMASSAS